MADEAEVDELPNVATAGTTGALAAYEAIAGQRAMLLDAISGPHHAVELLATQAAKAAQIGAFATLTAGLLGFDMNPALKSLTALSATTTGSTLTALATAAASVDTHPALKSLTAALSAVGSYPTLEAFAGIITGHESAADRLRPMFEGAGIGPNTGTSAWLARKWWATKPDLGVAAAMKYPTQSVLDSIRPISTLLEQVGHTNSLAEMILGAGATSDALDRITGLGKASAAVASIARFVKPYELPNIGLMTNLAATRALLDIATPLTGPVDRIGMGWASLGDRFVRGDLELAALIPSSNRLATKAYQLDILVGQDDLTDAEELFTTRKDGFDFVAECLARLNMRLCNRWNGMWDRMEQRGADWQSQAANSAVELVDGLLNELAPDDKVRDWQVASGLHNNPDLYLKNGTKGPTRRLKLFYLGDQYRVNRITIHGLFMDVPATVDALQSVKHGSMSDEMFESAVSLIGDVIAILVPNRRR